MPHNLENSSNLTSTKFSSNSSTTDKILPYMPTITRLNNEEEDNAGVGASTTTTTKEEREIAAIRESTRIVDGARRRRLWGTFRRRRKRRGKGRWKPIQQVYQQDVEIAKCSKETLEIVFKLKFKHLKQTNQSLMPLNSATLYWVHRNGRQTTCQGKHLKQIRFLMPLVSIIRLDGKQLIFQGKTKPKPLKQVKLLISLNSIIFQLIRLIGKQITFQG